MHHDPLAGVEENRKPGIGITITIPFRNADEGGDDEE